MAPDPIAIGASAPSVKGAWGAAPLKLQKAPLRRLRGATSHPPNNEEEKAEGPAVSEPEPQQPNTKGQARQKLREGDAGGLDKEGRPQGAADTSSLDYEDWDPVLRVTGKKSSRSVPTMYRVVWRGWGDEPSYTTWEAAEHLECFSAIAKYEEECKKKKGKGCLETNTKSVGRSRAAHEVDWKRGRTGGKRNPAPSRSGPRSCFWGPPPAPKTKAPPSITITPRAASSTAMDEPTTDDTVSVGGCRYQIKKFRESRVFTPHCPPLDGPSIHLLHGTIAPYAKSILRTGFRLPRVRSGHGIGAVRPHMFGKGVYLTSHLSKASHFGPVVLVCKIRMGRMATLVEADWDMDLPKLNAMGFDSIYAPPGAGGNVFDEYCFFLPGQITPVGYLK